jgi:SHS2 domain-containing protein
MFEFKDLEEIKHFLEIKIIIQDESDDETVYLVQDAYVDKLMKEYEIRESAKVQISLSSSSTLAKYDEEIDQQRMHEYRRKVSSICYSATMIRSNITKTTSKLIEFLINSESDHLIAANHCMRYLQNTKYLRIRYIAFDEDELTVAARKHVFETIVDVSFVNENDRISAERYAFKLFDELID